MDSIENQLRGSSESTPVNDAEAGSQQHVTEEYKVYRPMKTTISTPQRDLPEAYFEPTKTDIKLAQDSLRARTEALVNAPFRTSQMRELAEKSKSEKYPTATIRIKFADQTQLEKTFPSSNKIKAVYAFVLGLLRENVRSIKFILYQTPPPRELKVSDPKVRDATLLQLQLVPTAVLYLKFLDESLNHNDVAAPLDPVVLARAIDLPIPPSPVESSEKPSAVSKTSGTTRGSSTSTDATSKTGLAIKSGEAQKKLNKFFKNLGPKS